MYLHKKQTLFEKFLVQTRVIKALMTRELLTEFGRKNIGFLWIFIEPIIFISLIMLLRNYILGSSRGAQAVEHHIPLTGFLLTGYVMFMLVRRGLSYVSSSSTSNRGIMFHANVKTINLFLSRFFLEVLALSFVAIFLSLFFIYFDTLSFPNSYLLTVLGWGSICWFFLGFSLIYAFVVHQFPFINRYRILVLIILLSTSAVFYMISWLPKEQQGIILYNPLAHSMELFREGFFGEYINAIYSPIYMIGVNSFLTFFGLILSRKFKRQLN